jgi:hypothetical protein
MENAMKNPILRSLIRAILFSLLSGSIIVIAGLVLGWKTSTQFSDGFFWAGAIMISLGLLSVLGGYSTAAGTQYSQSMARLDPAERSKSWAEDTARNYHILAFLGTAGLLLLGLSGLAILIGNLF